MRKITGIVLVLCVVSTVSVCFGWSGVHLAMTESAFNVLPQWEKDLWNRISHDPVWDKTAARSDMLFRNANKSYVYNCDNFCSWPTCAVRLDVSDYLYGELNGKYAHPVPSPPADSEPCSDKPVQGNHFHYLNWSDIGGTRDYTYRAAKWYFEQAVMHLQNSEPLKAAKILGSFFHGLQDSTSPYHCLDGLVDVRESYVAYSSSVSDANFAFFALDDSNTNTDISGYVPITLGTSIDAAAKETADRFVAANQYSQSLIPDFVKAHKQDDWRNRHSGAATDAVVSLMAQNDAKLIADVFHTVYYLAMSQH